MPRRPRIPLPGREVDPERGRDDGSRQPEARRSLDFLGKRATEVVGDVHVAALEHRQARRVVGDATEYQTLDGRHSAPEALVGLEDELDTGCEGHETIGTGPDRRLLEAILSHTLHVATGDDPGGAGRRRAEEGHEVGPGLLESNAHMMRIDDLDGGDLLLENPGGRPAIALERELHV